MEKNALFAAAVLIAGMSQFASASLSIVDLPAGLGTTNFTSSENR